MAQTGLIEPENKGPRDRQPYAITGAGRKAFEAWIEQEPGPETIRFPLLLTVAFGRHIRKKKLNSIVARHLAMHSERLADYEKKLNDPESEVHRDIYALACLHFGAHYERAVLDWFEALPAVVRGKIASPANRPGGQLLGDGIRVCC